MSIVPSKIAKAVTLKPGEQFILPPGAKLLSSTDVDSISSTCDIGELQSMKCYVTLFAIGAHEGSAPQAWEKDSTQLIGVRYNGNEILFPIAHDFDNSGHLVNPTGMLAGLTALSTVGELLTQSCYTYSNNGSNAGSINAISFSTMETVANNIWFMVRTNVTGVNETSTNVAYFPCDTIESVRSKGYTQVCDCGSGAATP